MNTYIPKSDIGEKSLSCAKFHSSNIIHMYILNVYDPLLCDLRICDVPEFVQVEEFPNQIFFKIIISQFSFRKSLLKCDKFLRV